MKHRTTVNTFTVRKCNSRPVLQWKFCIYSLQRKMVNAKRKQKVASHAECNGNGAYSSKNTLHPKITTLEDTLKSLLPVFITLQKTVPTCYKQKLQILKNFHGSLRKNAGLAFGVRKCPSSLIRTVHEPSVLAGPSLPRKWVEREAGR